MLKKQIREALKKPIDKGIALFIIGLSAVAFQALVSSQLTLNYKAIIGLLSTLLSCMAFLLQHYCLGSKGDEHQ